MTQSRLDSTGRDNSDDIFADAVKAGLPEEAANDQAEQLASLAEVDAAVMDACGKNPAELMTLVRQIDNQSTTYMTSTTKAAWERSYRAYRNEHFQGSKYLSPRYRQRSKLFRPKTRSAVRKNMASAAAALFASVDAVSVTAEDSGDTNKVAAASLAHELLNYRLDRSSGRNAIPWFLTAMGCHQSAQITGICASIQTWIYKEDETGRRIMDRPDATDIPPENLGIDPNADWRDPAQASGYVVIRWPLPLWEVREKMKRGATRRDDRTAWIDIPDDELESIATSQPQDASGIRRAREGGTDKEDQTKSGPYRVVWCYQIFMRIGGTDYTFWTLGRERLLSIPQKTEDLYPHLGGERPIVIGYGAIEAHRPYPMAPVESWQQLQQEANDIVNLRLDQMKHVVNPIAKVKRGRQVDIEQIQRRSPDGVLLLQDMEDVDWDRPPDVPASAYRDADYINADLDELAGSFSTSSVQSNRQLGETVGGMRLMSGAAGSVTEFDLRVWIETWAERVMWQLLRLEQFYEDDATVLAIAGEKAQLFQKFGIDAITDQLLLSDVTLRVSIGLGNSDPMQALQKFGAAAKIAGDMLMPFMGMPGAPMVTPKPKEIIDEIFGKAGYKDAAERFFEVGEPMQPPPGEEGADGAAQAEAKIAETQMKLEDAKEERAAKYADKEKDRELKLILQQMQAQAAQQQKLLEIVIGSMAQREEAQAMAGIDRENRMVDRQFEQQDKAQERQFSEKDQRRQRVQAIMERDREDKFRDRELSIAEKAAMAKAKARPTNGR